MMLPEHEDFLKSFFQRILHDVVHDLAACCIKSCSMAVDDVSEISNFVKEKDEYSPDIFVEHFKFLII